MKNYMYITLGIVAFITGLGLTLPSVIVAMLPLVLTGIILFYPRLVMKKFALSSVGIRIYFLYLTSLFSVLLMAYSMGFTGRDMIRKIVIIILFVSFLLLIFMKFVIFKDKGIKRKLIASLLIHTYLIGLCIVPFILVHTAD